MAWDNSINVANSLSLKDYFSDKAASLTNSLNLKPIIPNFISPFISNAERDFAQNSFTGREVSVLAYPIDIDPEQDHLEIDEMEYRRPGTGKQGENVLTGANSQQNAAGPGASTAADYAIGGSIILPMPKVTDTNGAEWGKSELTGDEMNRSNRASSWKHTDAFQGGRDNEQDAENIAREGGRGQQTRGRGGGRSDNQTNYWWSRELMLRAKSVQRNIGGNVTADSFLARERGQILNPNAELLFQGPILRSFSFSWLMVARSQREGREIRRIIRKLKKGAAPKWNNTALLETPSIWQLTYKSGRNTLKTANRFKQCALTSITVDYAPDGIWTAYDDSQPVALRMGLGFKELRAVYETDQEDASLNDSVGF